MRLFHWMFIVLLFFAVVLVALWLVAPPPAATGMVHPDFPSMQRGGESQSSLPGPRLLSSLFGLLVIGLFALSMAAGYRRKERLGGVKYWLLAGFAGYVMVYSGMVVSYWKYIEQQTQTVYLGGVPAPTAWMLYGMWLFPFLFTILYSCNFDRWVITPEDLERFRQLVEENRSNSAGTED